MCDTFLVPVWLNSAFSFAYSSQREFPGHLSDSLTLAVAVWGGIDHLARSTLHLCQIADALARKGVQLQVIDQNIDTSDAIERLLFNMLGAIAQFATEIRAERQMDGIHKARGIQFGARPKLTAEQIADLRQRCLQGDLLRVLMQDYNISKAIVYCYLSDDLRSENT